MNKRLNVKERSIFEGATTCPHCQKTIEIKVMRKTLEAGKKAVTEDHLLVDKSLQTQFKS